METAQKSRSTSVWMTAAACLWLGLFPLLLFGSYAHITRDKWVIMLALSGLTLLCFAADGLGRRLRPARRVPLLLALGLLLWMGISCLLSPFDASVWWIGGSVRREGLATQLCYLGLFLMFAHARVHLPALLASAAAGAVGFAAVVLLQRQGLNPLGLYPEGASFWTHPEFQGTIGNIDLDTGYLCLLAGLFLAGLLWAARGMAGQGKASRRWMLPVCLPALALTVYLILTMGVQFGLVTLGALAVLTVLLHLPRRGRILFLACVLLLALGVAWFWPGQGGGLWELHEMLHGRTRLSFGSNRLAVWVYSLGLFTERPVLGGGADTFQFRFGSYLERHGLQIPTMQDGVLLPHDFDTPHNEVIAHLVNEGLPGALLFIALLAAALLPLLRFRRGSGDGEEVRWIPAMAVFCYAVQACFCYSVCLVAPLFWVLLGMASGGAGNGQDRFLNRKRTGNRKIASAAERKAEKQNLRV